MKLKDFCEILNESKFDTLDLDDLIQEGFNVLNEFAVTLKKMAFYKQSLIESTVDGNRYIKRLKALCEELDNSCNKMQDFIDKKFQPKFDSVNSVIRSINNTEIPYVLSILKEVFDNPIYDDQDKHDTHKWCQIYDQLLTKYKHKIHQFKIMFPTKINQSIGSLNMKNKKGFTLAPQELEKVIK